MARIEWLDSHYCNIDTIDEQHINILKLINELDQAAANRDREKVGHVLNDIVATIISHFEFEEELMSASGYGHLKAHKKLHDRFVEKLVNFAQRYDAGECIIDEFHPFLQEWFHRHIEEDRDYCLSAAAEMNASTEKEKSEKDKGWFARTFGSKDKD